MDQLKFLYREDVPHLLLLAIQKAKEGVIEAQYICWETHRWQLANPTFPYSQELFEFIAPIELNSFTDNIKIGSLLPFYKQREKLKKELDRLKFGALYLKTLEDIKRSRDFTVGEAEELLVNIAMANCSSTNPEHIYATALLRINTRSKLKDEIRFYFRHYEKWAFYLDQLTSMGLPFRHLSKHKIPTKETS